MESSRCEILDWRGRWWEEKRDPAESRAMSGSSVNARGRVAVLGSANVSIKAVIFLGITNDCSIFLFGQQRESPRIDVMLILQREKETVLSVTPLKIFPCPKRGRPLGGETGKRQNHPVRPPKKRERPLLKLYEDLRKFRNDQRIDRTGRRWEKMCTHIGRADPD
jgi:hypothetical protein